MQIKAITVNTVNTTVLSNGQGAGTLMQANNNMFAPECKVTISKEGKRISRQQTEQTQESAQDVTVQKMMLRRQEEAEQDKKVAEGYREQLRDIEKKINDLNRSFKTKADTETIEKEQKVLRNIREQKQAQLEENHRLAEEARGLAAMQNAKNQEDIDGNNRKLWTLLKTLEEAEKAKKEQEGGVAENNSGRGTSEGENSVGGTIQNSAAQFTVASMRRDLYVDEQLEGLNSLGHEYIDFANTITNNILKESEKIRTALDAEDYTDDMKAELVNHLQEEATLSRGNVQSYGSIEWFRNNGLHILQESRDYKIKRIADNPLAGMQEAKDSMMMSAADAVLGEARQSRLDETSKELEDEVQKLIDERNDINKAPEEKEEGEKAEDSKDLTNTKAETEKEEDEQEEVLKEQI